MEKLNQSGVLSETCRITGISYHQKLFASPAPDGGVPGMVVLINGIGLDRDGFLPFFEHISLPSIRLAYCYKTYAHLAVTVPGFEESANPRADSLYSMDKQAALLEEFIRERVQELRPGKIVLYSFSYGSDLMVPLLALLVEDGRIQPLLARMVVAEINVSASSCFITSRIRAALEGVQTLPATQRMRGAHTQFFDAVLKAYRFGEISTGLMADLADYFTAIITKNWYQLASNSREVTTAPENRIWHLFTLLKRIPDTDLDFVFSDPADIKGFAALRAKSGMAFPWLRVLDETSQEHFFHIKKEGILRNLNRPSAGLGR